MKYRINKETMKVSLCSIAGLNGTANRNNFES